MSAGAPAAQDRHREPRGGQAVLEAGVDAARHQPLAHLRRHRAVGRRRRGRGNPRQRVAGGEGLPGVIERERRGQQQVARRRLACAAPPGPGRTTARGRRGRRSACRAARGRRPRCWRGACSTSGWRPRPRRSAAASAGKWRGRGTAPMPITSRTPVNRLARRPRRERIVADAAEDDRHAWAAGRARGRGGTAAPDRRRR